MKKVQKILSILTREIKKVGSRQKIIISTILVSCFFAGLLIPFFIQNQNSSLFPFTLFSIKQTGKADLKILSGKINPHAKETFTATVYIDSFENGVEAADFLIKFDPDYLKAISLANGSFFGSYPISLINPGSVKLSGVAQKAENRFIIPKGKGTIVTILFEAIKPVSSTQITVDRNKTIIASEGKNILNKSENLTLKIN